MSKNLTRKGLALGALVALGSSVIAGPAYAVDPVSLAPTTGTTYTTILGETFNLKSQFTDAAQLASENLKFVITDSSAKLDTANGSTVTLTNSKYITWDAADKTTPGAVNDLALVAKSTATANFSVTVQAWLDFDGDNTINNGEAASEVRTVNFVTVANSGLTTSWSALTVGDTTATASIKFAADVNVSQLTKANYSIAFGKLNSSGVAETAGGRGNWVTGSTDSGDTVDVDDATTPTALKATDSITAATSAIYVAQALKATATAGIFAAVGDPVYYTPAKVVATTVDAPNATVGDDIRKNGWNYDVRSGATSVAISSKVTKTNDAADAQVAAAGIVATVTVSVDTIDSADTISVGGVSFAGAAGSKTFTATSDADGKFNFTVASLSGKKGTSLYVTIKVAGLGSTRSVQYNWVDATIAAGALTDTIVGASATRQIVKGGAVSIKYALKDDFGKLVSGSNYRLQVVAAGNGTDATTARVQPTFVDGYATASFTDGSTAAGTVSVLADLQVLDANNNWASTNATSLLKAQLTQVSVSVQVLAVAPVVNAITIAKSAGFYSLDAKDFVTGDSNYTRLTAPAYTTDATTISGDVVDVLGAGIAGQSVTVSAPGVQFVADGVYAVGSITVVTGTNGVYTVAARSHTAGKTVFTATTGSVSKTVTVTFNEAAADSGTSLVVTAPASAVPGKSVTVSAKLTDKWGNAVNTADGIAFTSTGAGYFVTKATETDATGVAEAVFVTQAGDAGTVKFTVAYTVPAADADDLTTSASTVFAAAVVVDPSASVATVTVTPASTTSQAGRALDVTVKAVDASGAAVAGAVVALSSTGAGSLSAASVVTGAAGTATVKLVAGASDLGAAVVTATSNAKSHSATVEFGATDASVDLIGKRVYVTTEFAAGKRVTIYDNGVRRYSAIQTTDAEKVVMWNVKAGSHTIVVKISGASSDSVTFDVK